VTNDYQNILYRVQITTPVNEKAFQMKRIQQKLMIDRLQKLQHSTPKTLIHNHSLTVNVQRNGHSSTGFVVLVKNWKQLK
jgi:hypothetical protein